LAVCRYRLGFSYTEGKGVLTKHFWRCVFLRYHSAITIAPHRIALHHIMLPPNYYHTISHYYYQLSIIHQHLRISFHIPWLIQHDDKRATGASHDVISSVWTHTVVSNKYMCGAQMTRTRDKPIQHRMLVYCIPIHIWKRKENRDNLSASDTSSVLTYLTRRASNQWDPWTVPRVIPAQGTGSLSLLGKKTSNT
jgi:hypothetical protein